MKRTLLIMTAVFLFGIAALCAQIFGMFVADGSNEELKGFFMSLTAVSGIASLSCAYIAGGLS